MIGRRHLALAAVVALVAGHAPAPTRAAPIEVRVARGTEGVVAAGGIDLAVVEVVSGADVALTGTVEVDGGRHPVALAARGVATVTVARRLPAGTTALTGVLATVAIDGDPPVAVPVPAARVVVRPTVVLSDRPASALAVVEPWRLAQGLGEAVVVAPGRSLAWTALLGTGALVIDRPAPSLPPAAAELARRYLALGGRVCRLVDDGPPRCAQADAVAVPRTAVPARIGPRLTTWAVLAVALAATLVALTRLRRRGALTALVVVAGALGPAIGFVRRPDSALAVRGVRASAGAGEDWIAAEVGASELAGAFALGDALWIEPSLGGGGGPLERTGLAGRVPAPGSWRIRGFVAADGAGWVAGLTRASRPLPELP